MEPPYLTGERKSVFPSKGHERISASFEGMKEEVSSKIYFILVNHINDLTTVRLLWR